MPRWISPCSTARHLVHGALVLTVSRTRMMSPHTNNIALQRTTSLMRRRDLALAETADRTGSPRLAGPMDARIRSKTTDGHGRRWRLTATGRPFLPTSPAGNRQNQAAEAPLIARLSHDARIWR
jgi:hypothetical protein